MAINLGSGFSNNNQSGALNLKKNDILNLTKKDQGYKKV